MRALFRLVPALFLACVAAPLSAADADPADWPHYGGDAEGTRYSTANAITTDNVQDLRIAWKIRTGDMAVDPPPPRSHVVPGHAHPARGPVASSDAARPGPGPRPRDG